MEHTSPFRNCYFFPLKTSFKTQQTQPTCPRKYVFQIKNSTDLFVFPHRFSMLIHPSFLFKTIDLFTFVDSFRRNFAISCWIIQNLIFLPVSFTIHELLKLEAFQLPFNLKITPQPTIFPTSLNFLVEHSRKKAPTCSIKNPFNLRTHFHAKIERKTKSALFQLPNLDRRQAEKRRIKTNTEWKL